MKKVLASLVLVTLLAVPVVGMTQDEPPEIITDPQDIVDLIETVTNWVFTIVMLLAVLFIILAAFFYITAAGNPETIGKGKTMLIYALVGIAVALIARGLPLLIQAFLEG